MDTQQIQPLNVEEYQPSSPETGGGVWKKYLGMVWGWLKKGWRVVRKYGLRYFWVGLGKGIVWVKKFWRKEIIVKGRQIKLAWLVVLGLALVAIVWVLIAIFIGGGVKTETYKNKTYNYKVEVPEGWETQESDMGVLTLTEGDDQTGSCMINVLAPMLIPDKVNLEKFARSYRDQLENKFDFILSPVEFGKYKEAIKMHIKNGEHQNEDWYFVRDNGNVLVFQVEEYRRGQDGKPVDCEEKLNTVLK